MTKRRFAKTNHHHFNSEQFNSNSSKEEIIAAYNQKNAEFSLITSVQESIVKGTELGEIYEIVGERLRDLFDAQVVGINTIDIEKNLEYFHYLHEKGERIYPKPRSIDKTREHLVKSKKLILIDKDFSASVAKLLGETPKVVPGTELPKSILFVPMIVRGKVKGYISLQNIDKEEAFSPSDVHLLSTLTNSLSVALENARLFNETEQRNAELAVINSVQEGLVAEMDMLGIYNLVGNKIRDLFDAQVALIATFNYDHHTEEFQYIFEDGERFEMDPRPIDKVRQLLIDTKELLCINQDVDNEWIKITREEPTVVPGTKLTQSCIFVPMTVGSEVRGYVSLQNLDRENAFSDSDIRLLSTLVNSMSVALENARLFNETEQRNAELAVINSVQQGLVAEMDMLGIYNLVGNKIRDLFDAQVAAIVTFNYDNHTEEFQYIFEDGERFEMDPRPIDKVRQLLIDTKELLCINEDADNEWKKITGEEPTVVPGTKLTQSCIFVPMTVGKEVRGYVSLQNLDRENAFSDSDIRLLSTLVNSMSVALENARLFNETERRNAELAVINSVQHGLVAEMDLKAIFSLVGNRLCEVADTQTLIIRTFDHNQGLEIWEYAIENDQPLTNDPQPFIWANKILIKTKEPLVINEDYIETAKKHGDTKSGVTQGLPPKSAIFVPMMVGGSVIGSVSLQNVERENAFSESDVSLLTTLTNSMSVAIENARLFKETEQRASEMLTVNNISIALVSQLEFDALMILVGEQMKNTFNADIVYLAIHDLDSNMIHFPYSYGDDVESRPFGNGITEKIITSQEPLLINQNMDQAYSKIKVDKKGKMVESYLGVPIKSGKRSIGVISIQSTEEKNRFGENDLRLLTTIAANLGVAMQNAEAYRKLQAALSELKSAQQLLIQSEKMASLGELTAGIAHEIQNPLNFVNNFSEINQELAEELEEELNNGHYKEARAIALDIIENEKKINLHGRRADSIVKGMLQHSRNHRGEKSHTDINALCDEYLRLAYHGMRAKDKSFNATLETDFDKSIEKLMVVPQDIGRVVLNIINNSLFAIKDKQTKTDDSTYKPTIGVSTKKGKDTIAIRIKDNGMGIPDTVKDKIFQPFFTTKPTGQGTGLGLSMSYDIIKAHGGELTVDTVVNQGTTFIINLPKPEQY